jgi:hypothetical protein
MSEDRPKPTKWEIARFILVWILSFPFVVFREEIEAVLAILFVIASLAIGVWSFYNFPDHWYWITIPSVAILSMIAYPILKFADKIEAHFDKLSSQKK